MPVRRGDTTPRARSRSARGTLPARSKPQSGGDRRAPDRGRSRPQGAAGARARSLPPRAPPRRGRVRRRSGSRTTSSSTARWRSSGSASRDRTRRAPSARRSRRRAWGTRDRRAVRGGPRRRRASTSSPSSCAGRTLAQLIEDGALSDRDVLRDRRSRCATRSPTPTAAASSTATSSRGNVHRPRRTPPAGRREAHRLRHRPRARRRRADPHRRRGRHARLHGARAGRGPPGGEPADLYSLAIVLYEALAGVNPVRGRGPAATARRVGARAAAARPRCAATCRPSSARRSTRRAAAARGARHAAPTCAPRCRTRCATSPTRPAPSLASRTEALGRVGAAAMPSRPSDRVARSARAPPRSRRARWHGWARRRSCRRASAPLSPASCARCCRGWAGSPARCCCSSLAVGPGGRDRRRCWRCALGAPVPAAAAPRARALVERAGARAAARTSVGGGAAWPAIAGQAARAVAPRGARRARAWWAVLAGRVLGHGRAAWADDPAPPGATACSPSWATGRCSPWPACGRWPRSCCRCSCAEGVRARPRRRRAPGPPALAAGTQALAPDVGARRSSAPRSPACSRCSRARRARGRTLRSMTARHAAVGVPVAMSVLRSLEEKIAGLVEGAFGRVFRSRGAPGRARAQAGARDGRARTVSVSRTYVPNEYAIWLSPRGPRALRGRRARGASTS